MSPLSAQVRHMLTLYTQGLPHCPEKIIIIIMLKIMLKNKYINNADQRNETAIKNQAKESYLKS